MVLPENSEGSIISRGHRLFFFLAVHGQASMNMCKNLGWSPLSFGNI
uniref:Uncharacterized protein n=1 Tax=Anguilla anguilla TaxID=7936 RepID=A0A0E9WUU3_ANGAN